MLTHAVGFIRAAELPKLHVVGHDIGGLIALLIAAEYPEMFASLCVACSPWAAPAGDGVDNLTLLQTPEPRWARASQQWAYERLSYSHLHVDDELLDRSRAAAETLTHEESVKAMASGGYPNTFMTSVMKNKSRFFKVARESGIAVPVQVIAAQQGPMVNPENMLWLFRILAQHQTASQFHIINRSGSFPFREQAPEFVRVAKAFQDGVAATFPWEKEICLPTMWPNCVRRPWCRCGHAIADAR
jgi:2-hydroxy-6-oxonona-2,4-dienedioate hydrolase